MNIRIGVIGYGYWGPNLVRNFIKIDKCKIVAISDLSRNRLEIARKLYPFVETTQKSQELLQRKDIDAIVIATPVATHFQLAKEALMHNKHVLIEKPMVETTSQAKELVKLAKENQKILMVDHTFIFTGAVRKIKELINSGEIGEIYYVDSVRVNLGLFQHDVNVLWDLGPHDFSILKYLIPEKPLSVSAFGAVHANYGDKPLENICYVTIKYQNNLIVHFHLNWLSPVKIRRTLIAGSKKMVIYDHLDPDNQVKVFDRGIDVVTPEDRYQTLIQYRTGDMYAPKLDQTEALELVCKHFIQCIFTGQKPITNGEMGFKVVQLLEAAQKSLERGEVIKL